MKYGRYITIMALLLSAVLQPAIADTANSAPTVPITDTDFTVRAGDVLQVTVWKEDSLDRETLVLPDGTITFPLIGTFNAAGLTPAQLQDAIKIKLEPLIPNAAVTVLVKAPSGHTISVIGQVAKPGELVMNHRTTAMQALSQAGGLTPYASEGKIIILRQIGSAETAIPFPYRDVAEGKNLNEDVALMPGDVIVIPTSGLF